MRFVFQVEAEAERTEGKLATREDIGDQILQEIEGADPGQISGENGGEYAITTWEVTEVGQKRGRR